MIRHVVFFKFKADADETERAHALAELRKLPDKIDLIRSFELGSDILRSPRSWDAVLIATYDDRRSLQQYAQHPAHLPVVELMKSVSEAIGSVDFEI
jgi:hypothetical protein